MAGVFYKMSLQYIKYGAYYIIALAYSRIQPAGRYMPFRITLTQIRAYFLLRKSKIFDRQWYLQRYPDVADSNIDPICHFVLHGFCEGRVPNQSLEKYIRNGAANAQNISYTKYAEVARILYQENRGHLKNFDDDLVASGLKYFEKLPLFNKTDYFDLNQELMRVPGLNASKHAFLYGISEGRAIFNKKCVAKQLGIYSKCVKATQKQSDYVNANRNCFSVVYNETGNLFLMEFAECIAYDLRDAGHDVALLTENDDPSKITENNIIIAPHEFFFLGKWADVVNNRLLRHSVVLNTEQPQTLWFERAVPYTMMSRGVIDISPQVAAIYAATGFPSVHCDLSGPEVRDVLPQDEDAFFRVLPKRAKAIGNRTSRIEDRAIDVSFFGAISEHRDRFFSKTARFFSDYKCIFYCRRSPLPLTHQKGVNMLNAARHVGFHSKIVLNIHRDEFGFFEWHRMVRLGIETGAIVVSEPCLAHPYFQPNQHYFEESGRHIQNLVEWLLRSRDGQDEAETVRHNALELVDQRRGSQSAGRTIANFVCSRTSKL